MVAGNSAECHAMCYKTNVAVAALSCSGLSPAHCSSGQFYESDWHGVRRLCVVKGAECQADPANKCPASLPLCSDASVQASVRRSVHGKGPEAENASPAMPEEIPAFCSSLCEKTNTRSMNVSCRDLPAASCESRGFYETDHDGQRRLCIQQGGECITDLSAVCAEHFPICDVAFDGEASNQSTHCFLYCDKINTRRRSFFSLQNTINQAILHQQLLFGNGVLRRTVQLEVQKDQKRYCITLQADSLCLYTQVKEGYTDWLSFPRLFSC